MKICLNYEKISAGTARCKACAHFCVITDGAVGFCGVRQNLGGELYLLVYGQAVAVNVDPMEKKPLYHFLPGSRAFSLGTLGCNFVCANCQNYDIAQMSGRKGKVKNYVEINWGHDLPPEKIVKLARENNCPSLAYTYNEPTIFLEYALDTMKLARQQGLKNVWVSNGYLSGQTLDMIKPYLDAVNVDIKSFSDKFYQTNCGARLEPVLENCRKLVGAGVWLEITTLIIPTLTDGEKMLKQIAGFIKNELGDFVPWHVSAFAGAISWKLADLPDTPVASLEKAYEIGKAAGLKYVYAGNLSLTGAANTYCPACGKIVIKRQGYNIARFDRRGQCPNCGEKIQGAFN